MKLLSWMLSLYFFHLTFQFFKLYHAGICLGSINLQLCSNHSPRAQVHYVHVQPPLTLFQVLCYDYSCLTCCTIGSSVCPDNSAVMFTVLAALAITSYYIILITQTLTFEWYQVQNSDPEKKGSFNFRVFYLSVLLNCLFSHNAFHIPSQPFIVFFQKPWKTV